MTTLVEPAATPTEQTPLPPGWVWTTLGHVLTVVAKKVEPNQAADAVYIGLEHISKGTGQLLATGLGSEVTSTKTAFEPDDVLYGKLRPYLSKVALALTSGICSTDILALRPLVGVVPEFLKYRLLSRDFVMFASSNVNGVQHPRVDARTVTSFPLSLPPLPEQQRIVTRIEELFSKLDAGVAELKRTQALLKRYRQSLLHAAVTGELSRDWRAQNPVTETGAELLARILEERRERWKQSGKKGKYEEPQGPDVAGLPELPDGWVWARIGQAFEVSVGATPSRARADFWASDEGIPWISSGEVAFCRIKKTKERITETGYKASSTRIHPIGTVLIGMIGEGKTRGQVAILDIAACNNQNSAAIRISETPVVSEYIYHYLASRYEESRRVAAGNNQPALNKSRVEAMIFPLPPLPEQTYIVSEVERRLSILDNMEATVAVELKRAESTRQSILHRAFTGGLVPQDPNDEPASVLLERIQAEKLKAGAKSIREGAGKRGRPRRAPSQPTLLEEQ